MQIFIRLIYPFNDDLLDLVYMIFIVEPVIIYRRFEETGNQLPYYKHCLGKEQVDKYFQNLLYLGKAVL